MRVNTAILGFVMIWVAGLAHAERLAVTANVANVRSGPGTKYDVIWKIEKYHPIFVILKANPWYQFKDFEGDKGWVHKSLVGKIKTVITRGDISNIRSGPGTKHKVLFKVEKGIPFKVITRKNQWIHIQHADGDEGWIHASLVW
jgi:SH3-like domain-containing protein